MTTSDFFFPLSHLKIDWCRKKKRKKQKTHTNCRTENNDKLWINSRFSFVIGSIKLCKTNFVFHKITKSRRIHLEFFIDEEFQSSLD